MSQRILLVDDEPDVIEAVRQRLEGFEVQAVRTVDNALVELGRNEYGLVLLDRCLAGDDAAQALGGVGHCESYIIEANRRLGDSRPEPVVYTAAGQSPVDLDCLRGMYREAAGGTRGDDARVAGLAVAIVRACAEEPSAQLAGRILRETRLAVGSPYAAFLARTGEGAKILCEAGSCRVVPTQSVAGWPARAGVTSVCGPGGAWISVSSGSRYALVVNAGADADAAHGLMVELGQPLAKLLERCYAVPTGRGGAVLLGALWSLVHDTRNYVTGLALCLDALAARTGNMAGTGHEPALVGMQLATLADICREYARIEAAGPGDGLRPDSRETVRAFACLLERFAVTVSRVEVDQRFALAPGLDGALARMLVAVTLELAQLRADGVSIECLAGDRPTAVCVRFTTPRKWMLATCLGRMREACELVDRVGGSAAVTGADGAGEVLIEFPGRDDGPDRAVEG